MPSFLTVIVVTTSDSPGREATGAPSSMRTWTVTPLGNPESVYMIVPPTATVEGLTVEAVPVVEGPVLVSALATGLVETTATKEARSTKQTMTSIRGDPWRHLKPIRCRLGPGRRSRRTRSVVRNIRIICSHLLSTTACSGPLTMSLTLSYYTVSAPARKPQPRGGPWCAQRHP